mmetsp:Transcript_89666/g.171863  ORF Transcript_89666/g.171863 Transcript_89666/m.171863 type:complete len:458 (-) Transcript_89666:138-1511(-)
MSHMGLQPKMVARKMICEMTHRTDSVRCRGHRSRPQMDESSAKRRRCAGFSCVTPAVRSRREASDCQVQRLCMRGSRHPATRRRRSFLELLVSHLRDLNRDRRNEVITKKLTHSQRVIIEKFLLQHHTGASQSLVQGHVPRQADARPEVSPSDAASPSNGPPIEVQAGDTSAAVEGELDVTLKGTLAPASGSYKARYTRASSCNRGIGTQIKGGVKMYFASLGIDSLVFRCKSRPDREEAVRHLSLLREVRQGISTETPGDFEASVQKALDKALAKQKLGDNMDLGLKICVRVAASWWVGHDLHTPTHGPEEIGSVLAAWRRLRAARGRAHIGGRGILFRHTLSEINSMWTRIREEYLSTWVARGACVQKMSMRLDDLALARAPHRLRQVEHFEASCAARQRRSAACSARRKNRERRAVARLEKQRLRVQRKAAMREAKALCALENLIQRWPSRYSP